MLLMLASCGNDPKLSPVVGDWEAVDSEMEINMSMGGITFPLVSEDDGHTSYESGELVFSLKKNNSLWQNGDSIGIYTYDNDSKRLTIHSNKFIEEADAETIVVMKELGVDMTTLICNVPTLTKEVAVVDYQSSTPVTIKRNELPFDLPDTFPDEISETINISAIFNLKKLATK